LVTLFYLLPTAPTNPTDNRREEEEAIMVDAAEQRRAMRGARRDRTRASEDTLEQRRVYMDRRKLERKREEVDTDMHIDTLTHNH
jgi:hypothetical protein